MFLLMFSSIIFDPIFLVTAVILTYFSLKVFSKKSKLPEGPRGLPIVGYLPFLGKKPYEKLVEIGKIYGNIFSLQMGSMNALILNDWTAIKEAFRKDTFLGRPDNIAFNVLFDLKGTTIEPFHNLYSLHTRQCLGTLSGREWKEQKRFTMHQLRNLGFGKTAMEEHIKSEVEVLSRNIEEIGLNEPVRMRPLLSSFTSCCIAAFVFGKRFDHNDPSRVMMDAAIQRAVKKLGQTGIVTFFPRLAKIFAFFNLFGLGQVKKDFLDVNNYIHEEIDKHEKTFNADIIRDYIDGFLLEMQNKATEPNNSFTREMLAGNLQGFFAAGTETVKTMLEWCFLTVAAYKKVQEKVQSEIDAVIGYDRTPCWMDRLQMPFTQAVIAEIHRWRSVSPFNLLRCTTENTTVQGFEIAKDTPVIANLWAVHYDSKIWQDPHKFDPSRFLSKDGKSFFKREELIPFSIGKRSCPGETLAQVEVFLCLVGILQKFTLTPTDYLSFEDELGMMLQPKTPLTLMFDSRKNNLSKNVNQVIT